MRAGRPDVPGVWLLDLEVGGHVYRYATEAVDVEDADGRALPYREGLSEPALSFGSVFGAGDASVSVSLSADVDWALLVERGHALDRCPAVLRRWYDGLTLVRARVVLRGLSSAPSYGALGEPLSLSVVRSMRAQTRMIPPAQAIVDASTWPITTGTVHTIPDKANGAAYPLVIGAPGDDGSGTPVCVVPAPMAEFRATATATSRLVWLGGSSGANVRIAYTQSTGTAAAEVDRAIGSTADLLGRTVAYSLPLNDDIEATYLLGFAMSGSYGGGIEYRGETLRGAGSIIEWVLREHYDGPVDWGRLLAVCAYLDSFKIDTYINSLVSANDWLGREVLPLLPVEMREGPRGIYPALIRYDLTRRDAVAHLDATSGSGRVQRESAVTVVSDIANEITVEYRPSAESGARWLARAILTAQAGKVSGTDASDGTDTRILGSQVCAESQRRYGIRPLRIQAGAFWDSASAGLTAQHIAARRAWPRRAVTYSGGSWLEGIEVGSAVTLTDPDIRIEDAVALAVDVTPQPGGSQIDLVLLDGPVTRRRATS